MNDLLLGRYYPGGSPLHRLDPRAKLLLTLVSGTLTALAGPRSLIFLTMAALAACAISGVPATLYLRSFRPIFLIFLLTFGLQLFTDPGQVVFRAGPLTMTNTGLTLGVEGGARLALLVLFASLLTLTTSPLDLADGVGMLLSPLQRLRLPAGEFALMMSISLRFIPVLLDEAEKVRLAQEARGADFSGRGLKKLRLILPLLVPLFVGVFRRAEELATAMEARGYRPGQRRSRLRQAVFTIRDYLAISLGGVLAGVVWWLR